MILERIQLNRRTSLDTVIEHDNTTVGDEVDQDCIIKEELYKWQKSATRRDKYCRGISTGNS